MASLDTLLPDQCYQLVREFVDYDGIRHPVGETWVFVGTHFLPYEAGLTLHVSQHGLPQVYRLQWQPEAQAAIIENFTDYVIAC